MDERDEEPPLSDFGRYSLANNLYGSGVATLDNLAHIRAPPTPYTFDALHSYPEINPAWYDRQAADRRRAQKYGGEGSGWDMSKMLIISVVISLVVAISIYFLVRRRNMANLSAIENNSTLNDAQNQNPPSNNKAATNQTTASPTGFGHTAINVSREAQLSPDALQVMRQAVLSN